MSRPDLPAGRQGQVDAEAFSRLARARETLRAVDFSRLMGFNITVFFVVSQLLSAALFGERPSPSLFLPGLGTVKRPEGERTRRTDADRRS